MTRAVVTGVAVTAVVRVAEAVVQTGAEVAAATAEAEAAVQAGLETTGMAAAAGRRSADRVRGGRSNSSTWHLQ